jgi:hypothetical protein
MKKILGLALLALPLLAVPARANVFCVPPYKVDIGANFYFRVIPVGAGPGACGPWYLYWPLEAHFVAPALPSYPYWPSPQGLPPGQSFGGPAAGPANFHQSGVQPAGYSPGYWYGR